MAAMAVMAAASPSPVVAVANRRDRFVIVSDYL